MGKCRLNCVGYGGLFAAALFGLNSTLSATVLTFDSDAAGQFGPDTVLQLNGSPMNANYGNRVSAFDDTTNHLAYGSDGGLTPNVAVSYYNASTYSTWGVATNVMTKQYDPFISPASDTVSVTFQADPGYTINLQSFDASYYAGGAFSVPIQVVDGSNDVLWSVNPLDGSGVVHEDFGGTPIAASQLTLQLLNPSNGIALNFGADNIQFSQTAVPEPASLALVAVAYAASARRRRSR